MYNSGGESIVWLQKEDGHIGQKDRKGYILCIVEIAVICFPTGQGHVLDVGQGQGWGRIFALAAVPG